MTLLAQPEYLLAILLILISPNAEEMDSIKEAEQNQKRNCLHVSGCTFARPRTADGCPIMKHRVGPTVVASGPHQFGPSHRSITSTTAISQPGTSPPTSQVDG